MASYELGKLCYVSSGSLARKYGASFSSLVFKTEGVKWCTVKVQFGKQSWECNTYNCYHEIQYSATGSWTSGSGSIDMSYSVSDCAEFKIKPNGTSTFTIKIIASTNCKAISSESPGASCYVVASQNGATPRTTGNTICPPNTSVNIRVNFDSNGKLSSIQ